MTTVIYRHCRSSGHALLKKIGHGVEKKGTD